MGVRSNINNISRILGIIGGYKAAVEVSKSLHMGNDLSFSIAALTGGEIAMRLSDSIIQKIEKAKYKNIKNVNTIPSSLKLHTDYVKGKKQLYRNSAIISREDIIQAISSNSGRLAGFYGTMSLLKLMHQQSLLPDQPIVIQGSLMAGTIAGSMLGAKIADKVVYQINKFNNRDVITNKKYTK